MASYAIGTHALTPTLSREAGEGVWSPRPAEERVQGEGQAPIYPIAYSIRKMYDCNR
jgi:hypothetical protein